MGERCDCEERVMAEYIEREALLKSILELPPKMDEQGYGWLGRRGVWQVVSDFPAADVRPVVLCKDCAYSYDSVGGWCCSHGICVDCIVRADFFCADGEREES